MSLTRYEWEVLMESGIIYKVYTFDHMRAGSAVYSIKQGDLPQAYRKVGTTEWIVY